MRAVCLLALAVTPAGAASPGPNDTVDALLAHPIRARGHHASPSDEGRCDAQAGEKRRAIGGPPCDVWGAVTAQTVGELASRCPDVGRMTPEARERLFAAITPELVGRPQYQVEAAGGAPGRDRRGVARGSASDVRRPRRT
jgi:hypothetical protein